MMFDIDIDFCHLLLTTIIFTILLAYAICDVNYFIRVVVTIAWGRIFEKQISVFDTTEINSIVITNDLDVNFRHMNTARFLRELDFARFHFYDRSGLYKAITSLDGHVLQTACNIRYRRTIPLFNTYKITTKVIYWSKRTIYFEQQFIGKDGFVHAISHCQQKTIGVNLPELLTKLSNSDCSKGPEMMPELELWIESMARSSDRLRKKE